MKQIVEDEELGKLKEWDDYVAYKNEVVQPAKDAEWEMNQVRISECIMCRPTVCILSSHRLRGVYELVECLGNGRQIFRRLLVTERES